MNTMLYWSVSLVFLSHKEREEACVTQSSSAWQYQSTSLMIVTHSLPREVLPFLQSAWDAALGGTYGEISTALSLLFIEKSFCYISHDFCFA